MSNSPSTSTPMETSNSSSTDMEASNSSSTAMEPSNSSSTAMEASNSSSTAMEVSNSSSTDMESSSSSAIEIDNIMQTGDLVPVEFLTQNMPPGHHFKPNDHEILGYLRHKILGLPMPAHHILEVNVYAHPPQNLADTYHPIGRNEWYFFSPASEPGVGSEFLNWNASGPSTLITQDDILLGFMKPMDYFQENEITDWAIEEYSLNMDDQIMPNHVVDNWTMCKLFRKSMFDDDIPPSSEEVEEDIGSHEVTEEESED